MSKGRQELSFYSLPEFEQWRVATEGAHSWKTKYYKGLGTSTAKEAKEYFSEMNRHRIPFKYGGAEDDDAIILVSNRVMLIIITLVLIALFPGLTKDTVPLPSAKSSFETCLASSPVLAKIARKSYMWYSEVSTRSQSRRDLNVTAQLYTHK